MGLLHGSLEEKPLMTGNGHRQVQCCGYMVYVCPGLSSLWLLLIVFGVIAGSGKTVFWYGLPQLFLTSMCSCCLPVQQSSKTSGQCVKLNQQSSPFFTLVIRIPPSWMPAASCPPFSFNSAINPIVSVKFFLPSTWPTIMVQDSLAKMSLCDACGI